MIRGRKRHLSKNKPKILENKETVLMKEITEKKDTKKGYILSLTQSPKINIKKKFKKKEGVV